MQPLHTLIGKTSEWRQPHAFQRHFDLHADGSVAATLHFERAFGSLATGTSADGAWTYKRVGFWESAVTVRQSGVDQNLAVFRNRTWTGGGTVTLSDGRTFQATTNTWQTRLEVATAAAEPLFHLHTSGLVRLGATLEILPAAARVRELPWLVLLAWYLVVKMHEETGDIVAMTATMG